MVVANRLDDVINVSDALILLWQRTHIFFVEGIEHQVVHALLIFIYICIHQNLQIYWCCDFLLHTIRINQVSIRNQIIL